MRRQPPGEVPLARIGWGIFSNIAVALLQMGVGLRLGSLSLLSDSLHNLGDAFGVGLSLAALLLARRGPDVKRTFGYHRAGVLAALANGVLVLGGGAVVAWEAVRRLASPPRVEGAYITFVSLVAFVVNAAFALLIFRWRDRDENLRGAFLHMSSDAALSLGVAVGGIFVARGFLLADPLVAIAVSLAIAVEAGRLIWGCLRVLMEAAPKGLGAEEVAAVLEEEGLRGCHDIHVWVLGGRLYAMSCHLAVEGEVSVEEAAALTRRLKEVARERLGIRHAVVEVEPATCSPGEVVCHLLRAEGAEARS